MKPIKEFIKMIRESFGGASIVYSQGSCFKLAKILQTVYGGELVDIGGHICLRLENRIWDINGEVKTDSFVGQEHVSPFYQNAFQRFDLVVDADRLPKEWGPDQLNTLAAREMQMLKFGHDLNTVALMIQSSWKGNKLVICGDGDFAGKHEDIEFSISLLHEGKTLHLYVLKKVESESDPYLGTDYFRCAKRE